MHGESKELLRYLDGTGMQFVIPVYQRNYDWSIEECEQLYNDLVDVMKKDKKSHFFGSIVSIGELKDKYIIIDGQQRLTTVSLMLLAISNLIVEGKLNTVSTSKAEMILNSYLRNQYAEQDDKRIKLKHVKKDEEAFDGLFKGKDHYIKSSNITANYEYFYNRMMQQAETYNADQWFDVISKLTIIDIELKHEEGDDPQLIFESINSTGKELSEADKIRNFVLMDQIESIQNRYYNDYWNVMEENTGYSISNLARYYLTIKLKKTPRIDNVYTVFKDYVLSNSLDIENVLKELTRYSKFYKMIIDCNAKDLINNFKINKSLFRLKQLESTVSYPFLLQVFEHFEDGLITDNELISILTTIETYAFRRIICGLPTNALNKIYATLDSDIAKLHAKKQYSFDDKMNYVLQNKTGSGAYPDDETFRDALQEKEIYRLNSKNTLYMLEKLENGDEKERMEVYGNDNISIEHIMPQHLTDWWREELGEDADDTHEEWLHKLGNLTLTAYNGEYSDRNFPEKLKYEDKKGNDVGLIASRFKLNDDVITKKHWTANEIEERQEKLIQKCFECWPMEMSSFIPERPEEQARYLNDGDSFMFTQPEAFELFGIRHKVESWTELIVEFFKVIYSKYPAKIYELSQRNDNHWGLYLSQTNDTWGKIADDLYLFTNTDTRRKVALINEVMTECGIDEEESPIVYISPDRHVPGYSKGNSTDSATDILRREFKQMLFAKTADEFSSTSQIDGRSTIDLYLGMSDALILTRMANGGDKLTTCIYIRRDKAIYDYMYAHKEEIEAEMGVELLWRRLDSKKSSQIKYSHGTWDISDKGQWDRLTDEIKDIAIKERDCFLKYYEEYKANKQ